jgi:transcriptional regulator with XRE-family HTH domain
MVVPRTYVSKIENRKCCPTLSTLVKLAAALEVTILDLLGDPERIREKQVAELLRDEFVSDLVPHVAKLSELQMRQILASVHGMLTRPRSAASPR